MLQKKSSLIIYRELYNYFLNNINININKKGLERPIYEVSSEERINELKTDVKIILKI